MWSGNLWAMIGNHFTSLRGSMGTCFTVTNIVKNGWFLRKSMYTTNFGNHQLWLIFEMNKSEHIAWNNGGSQNPTKMEHPWFVYKIDEKTGDKTDVQTEMHFEAKKLSKRELALT